MSTNKLRIALIDDDESRARYLQQSLNAHDYDVVACLLINQIHPHHLQQLQADVILLDMDHPQRDIIEACVNHFNLPTVLFTKNSNKDTIKNAIQAGVTAYIVDGIDPSRLDTILEIAIEQYKKHQKLESDLKETQLKLADRKVIEKAKNLLMHLHGLSEDAAFKLLRKNAMNARVSMGDLARQLLQAQQLLQQNFED
ncbi:MAG: ANTAR domain-containing protein [Acinetobacter sp.]